MQGTFLLQKLSKLCLKSRNSTQNFKKFHMEFENGTYPLGLNETKGVFTLGGLGKSPKTLVVPHLKEETIVNKVPSTKQVN